MLKFILNVFKIAKAMSFKKNFKLCLYYLIIIKKH